ncbi:SsgA family sporulation/cell division regulator [Streptomyces sp. NPDC002619]|uniref:SsgA family sporulation/cell division regulator n=1 Tax=Streptomyces sp. NPDC002619 TaxID=3364655 RepID=UPI003696E6F8
MLSLHMQLSYESADPYAVHALFLLDDHEPVEWVFARELLAQGLHRPTGPGDVHVWPLRGRDQYELCIALASPAGNALLIAPAREVASFLQRTDALVPPGTEAAHLDLDTQLARILAH